MRTRPGRIGQYLTKAICFSSLLLSMAGLARAADELDDCIILPVPERCEPPERMDHDAPSAAAAGPAEPVDPPTPVVSLRMRVPASSAASGEIFYRITVENASDAPAHHVTVRNPLPGNARYVRAQPEPTQRVPELLWQLGTLEPRAKKEISLVLQPTAGAEVKNCARVQFEHGQCVATRLARPELQLRKEGPTTARVNESLKYKIHLTNAGTAEALLVNLTDELPAGLAHASGKSRLTWLITRLGPGQTETLSYEVVARQAGRWSNKVSAASDGGKVRTETTSSVAVAEAKLGLNIRGPKQRYVDMPLTYQITVSNLGDLALREVEIDNPIPTGTVLVAAVPEASAKDSRLSWSLPVLEPKESRTFSISLKAGAEGEICNRVTARAEPDQNKQAESCTQIKGQAAVSLSIEDSEDPIEIGSATTYTIAVQSLGTTKVNDVRLVVELPPELNLVEVKERVKYEQRGRQLLIEPFDVAAGSVTRIRVEARAARPGDARFRVTMTARQLTAGEVQQMESTQVFAALPASLRKINRQKR